jgi:integrase
LCRSARSHGCCSGVHRARPLSAQTAPTSARPGLIPGFIFTTRTGRPVEPRNLVRSFTRICDDHGIRKIRLHALRHTTASLLKDLGVPPRDAQIILRHAHIATTQQIYTHVDQAARLDAITKLNKLLGGTE